MESNCHESVTSANNTWIFPSSGESNPKIINCWTRHFLTFILAFSFPKKPVKILANLYCWYFCCDQYDDIPTSNIIIIILLGEMFWFTNLVWIDCLWYWAFKYAYLTISYFWNNFFKFELEKFSIVLAKIAFLSKHSLMFWLIPIYQYISLYIGDGFFYFFLNIYHKISVIIHTTLPLVSVASFLVYVVSSTTFCHILEFSPVPHIKPVTVWVKLGKFQHHF